MKSEKVCEDLFKQAMACFPSGVTIVTTVDETGQKCGFTASAFSSLSLNPPLILVCLANNADCFDKFNNENQFAVNIIGAEHEALAFKFATKGSDKFEGGEFEQGSYGLPILSKSPVSLECNTENIYSGGDHIILVGQVKYLSVNGGAPTIWHEGKFHQLNK
ncbi:MAG: flavin reductase [Gammaproteobacteria bacterium]|nr:MAG: flavin reductase [Gammaproteobacteria bacterium]